MLRLIPLILLLGLIAIPAQAQNRIGTGKVRELYDEYCLQCHGEQLQGGLGGSLLDRSAWKKVGKTTSFLEYVKKGDSSTGMPSFEEALTDKEIRALEIFIDEVRRLEKREDSGASAEEKSSGRYSAGPYEFELETVVEDLDVPWAVEFLPGGDLLITERPGTLRVFKDGELLSPVEGIPEAWARGQGGLMEVALHPEFSENGWIYLGYSEASEGDGGGRQGMTKIVRGRIVDNQWLDEEVIFEVPERFHSSAGVHFGVRFVFQDGYLFFGIGDRGAQNQAQDLSRPNGKIHRIHDGGRVPEDNPFVDREDAYPTIWTYGNRNPQGLDIHPETGEIWESEHGPRGGDEINLIERGVNYGWPVITHGMNYDGSPITEKTSHPDMAQPKLHWTPSIAVCGMDFYEGEVFPEWKHDLFVGGLASEELHRLVIEDGEVVSDEIILADQGRIRDVAGGPDGHLYLVLNGPDRIVRLVPVD
ncbi:MAG: PQQ-dependent sugar dehydrogenase [Opitutales bacterium]